MTPNTTLESVIDEKWELTDPNPDIKQLFNSFNSKYFKSKLKNVKICWSTRMVVSAGICRFTPPRDCSIQLSDSILRFRPRRDLVETLLHEMIHAYLYIVDGDKEREEHGPKFMRQMKRINLLSGANITVCHEFHEEVAYYQSHWWMCNGMCSTEAPNYGIIMKSVNRNPGPWDTWWDEHSKTCKGKFIKIKEPVKRDQNRTHTSVSETKHTEGRKYINNPENKKPKKKVSRLSFTERALFKEKSDGEGQVDIDCNNKENALKEKTTRTKNRRSTIISTEPSIAIFHNRPHSVCQDAQNLTSQTSLILGTSHSKIDEWYTSTLDKLVTPFQTNGDSLTEDDNVFLNENCILSPSEKNGSEITGHYLQTVDSNKYAITYQSQPLDLRLSPSSSSSLIDTPCPICRTVFSHDTMTHHIKLCLSRFSISKP